MIIFLLKLAPGGDYQNSCQRHRFLAKSDRCTFAITNIQKNVLILPPDMQFLTRYRQPARFPLIPMYPFSTKHITRNLSPSATLFLP